MCACAFYASAAIETKHHAKPHIQQNVSHTQQLHLHVQARRGHNCITIVLYKCILCVNLHLDVQQSDVFISVRFGYRAEKIPCIQNMPHKNTLMQFAHACVKVGEHSGANERMHKLSQVGAHSRTNGLQWHFHTFIHKHTR